MSSGVPIIGWCRLLEDRRFALAEAINDVWNAFDSLAEDYEKLRKAKRKLKRKAKKLSKKKAKK